MTTATAIGSGAKIEQRELDITRIFAAPRESQLKDRALFARAFVACDTVCWPNDLDIAPETL